MNPFYVTYYTLLYSPSERKNSRNSCNISIFPDGTQTKNTRKANLFGCEDNLGHTDVTTTLNIYSHVYESMKVSSAVKLEAYYSKLEKRR